MTIDKLDELKSHFQQFMEIFQEVNPLFLEAEEFINYPRANSLDFIKVAASFNLRKGVMVVAAFKLRK